MRFIYPVFIPFFPPLAALNTAKSGLPVNAGLLNASLISLGLWMETFLEIFFF